MLNKIAMLTVHTSPLATLGGKEAGGLNVYVRELGRTLADRGIQVDIYTRSQDPTLPRIISMGDCIRLIHVTAGPEMPYSKVKVLDYIDAFVAGVQAQAKHDRVAYDLIYSHYWLSGIASIALREAWDIPFAQMFHTLALVKNRVAQSEAERDPVIRSDNEGLIMHEADQLIAATLSEREAMGELYAADTTKISIVPPGVNMQQFYPMAQNEARAKLGIPPDHKMILLIGRMQPIKGFDTLIRALAVVKHRDPSLLNDICVCIIGGDAGSDSHLEQTEFNRLNTLRDELGLDELVTFLGAKDQDTLAYYYAAAEMVVMPSRYESFGMVAIEAMACGTPVIASNVGGLAFSVADGFNGYLVPPYDAEALAEKVILLLKYPSLRDHLGEQARLWVERFNWDIIADEITDVFERMVTSYTHN